ncbi:universal stress protein [Mesoterricola silvestris]|uniref:Universal stress protein n=1 Tax=Mesoterricola silvestris TaxID=2927979 RepID=A0AA48GMA0_9BACT|nr:universal stress protein [Mesoterricola silvestris]BDU72100.1 universal stress protein [Mesoterricola silvestris]
MIHRVIVGVDFSDASRAALAKAAAWARTFGAPLVAVHVLQPPAPMLPEAQIALPDPAWLQSMEAHARDHLGQWVGDLPGTALEVKWGSPAEELVALADADSLLVVAQVGHSGIERLLFGSTAARVVKHAPCDVLVVRQGKVR